MRQGPEESATKFTIGTKKRGNDGNTWVIVKTKTSKRWSKKTSKTLKRKNANTTSVWGKNKPLEKFWRELASGKKIVIIYKNKPYKIETLPNGPATYKKLIAQYEEDASIAALLTSNMSGDAYEINLYPRAKDKTVDEVIKDYKKYFKTKMSDGKMLAP